MRIGLGDEGELVSVQELAERLLRDRAMYPGQMLRALAGQLHPEVFMQASAAEPPQCIGADWLYMTPAEGRRIISRGLGAGDAVARLVSPSYAGPAGFLTLWADEWERSGAAPSGAERVGFRKAWLRQAGFWSDAKPELLSCAPQAAPLDPPVRHAPVACTVEKPKIGPPDWVKSDQADKYQWTASNGLLEEINLQLKALTAYYTAKNGTDRGAVKAARSDLAKAWNISESMVKQRTTGDSLAEFNRRQQKTMDALSA